MTVSDQILTEKEVLDKNKSWLSRSALRRAREENRIRHRRVGKKITYLPEWVDEFYLSEVKGKPCPSLEEDGQTSGSTSNSKVSDIGSPNIGPQVVSMFGGMSPELEKSAADRLRQRTQTKPR